MSTKQIKNITNQRFGRLVVSAFVEIRKSKIYWLCVCDCGNKKIVEGHNLKYGKVKSCGCLQREVAAINAKLRRGTRAKITGNKKQCSNCKKFKLFKEFPNHGNQCKACRKEYRQRPEVKMKQRVSDKKYKKSEKGKAARKKYRQRPEVKMKQRVSDKKYKKSEKGKEAAQRMREKPTRKEAERKRLKIMNKKRIEELTDSYIKNKIMSVFKNIGLKPQDITPEMIEIKRDLLLFHRESRDLKSRLS